MASDFSVTWQCLSKGTIGFSLRIKLHAQVMTFNSSVSEIPEAYFACKGLRLKTHAGVRLEVCSRVARWYIFKPKTPVWVNFAMEDVGIFYGNLVYFPAIWSICGHLVYFMVIWYIFSRFWYVIPRKIWQPWYAG
jgi:hypothetical protein